MQPSPKADTLRPLFPNSLFSTIVPAFLSDLGERFISAFQLFLASSQLLFVLLLPLHPEDLILIVHATRTQDEFIPAPGSGIPNISPDRICALCQTRQYEFKSRQFGFGAFCRHSGAF